MIHSYKILGISYVYVYTTDKISIIIQILYSGNNIFLKISIYNVQWYEILFRIYVNERRNDIEYLQSWLRLR